MQLLEIINKKFDQVDIVVSCYSLRIVWASEKFHGILGYSNGELIDISITKIVMLDSLATTKMVTNILAGKKDDIRDLVRKDGQLVKLKIILNNLTYEEEPFVVMIDTKLFEN